MRERLAHPSAGAFPAALAVFSLVACGPAVLRAHDDIDPVAHWIFDARFVEDGRLAAQRGPAVPLPPNVVTDDHPGLGFLGDEPVAPVVAIGDAGFLPGESLTVAAWFTVDEPRRFGGIVGALEDNGNAEKGWCLGYDERTFTFALATTGADDGDGRMTYLAARTAHAPGRFFHVVATFDGAETAVYVNGKREAAARVQSGTILYPTDGNVALGGYLDRDENHPHRGRIRSVAVYDRAATESWVASEFERHRELAESAAPRVEPEAFEFVVPPYLTFATGDSVRVLWETTRESTSEVRFGRSIEFTHSAGHRPGTPETSTRHEVLVEGLEPDTAWFYQARSIDSRGRELLGPIRTFQTARSPDTPFGFVVISDTQSNPEVAGRIAEHAWGQRPHFVLHPGDLVGTGANKGDWTDQFFPSMGPLISQAPLFPVLGNHEGNARHYYDYMSLPEPEFFYEFIYGNAHFFMLDTNREVGPGSEQFRWLDAALARSTATWKIACHHHPPYSSDENDYGDLWKGPGTHGDLRVRQLTELYDRHGVDIVWNGHIHSYERTWPVRGERAVDAGGTIYLVTGGGGGGLETPGPTRPFFSNNVRRGHHYCYVAVNGNRLEFRAYDLENRLFDTMTIVKGRE